jgi:hypothetical protein
VYSFEWPAFALLAVFCWWRLIHEDPDSLRKRKQPLQQERTADGSLVPR